jgi:hypothetical protein
LIAEKPTMWIKIYAKNFQTSNIESTL